jgi:OOP family OmpA-OmpF porin
MLAVGSAIVLMVSGCALRERRWGGCAIGGALVGGALGGATGGATYNNAVDDAEDDERGAAIAAGIVGGAVIGTILGHALCDPIEEPPPPPPVAAPPPPPPPPPPAPGTKLGTVGSAFFDFDRATLKEGMDEGVLDDVVRVLKEQETVKVVIEAHTDSVGSDAYNMKLGERRAQAVKSYLVRQGIDATRIDTRSFGESKPVASNDTAAGRAQNRRAEVITE